MDLGIEKSDFFFAKKILVLLINHFDERFKFSKFESVLKKWADAEPTTYTSLFDGGFFVWSQSDRVLAKLGFRNFFFL